MPRDGRAHARRSQRWRARTRTAPTYAAPSASAHAVAFGSSDSGLVGCAAGAASRATIRSTANACGDSRSRMAARQRNQLGGDGDQARDQRPVEHARPAAADRRPLIDTSSAARRRTAAPSSSVRAGERDERPADEEKEDEGRGRTIRARLRRSSSCTGGRSTANSSTCSARNRPCSARPPRSAAASASPSRARARRGGGASSRRRRRT